MRTLGEKHPIIFELLLLIIGLFLSAILMQVINVFGIANEVSSSIARIITGCVFFAVFHKSFEFGNSFKGLLIMLPALLLAIYKIPYHFISGGGTPNSITLPIILIGLAPAVFEEILFRGIFIHNLKAKSESSTVIVLISAIVFSLVHLTNIAGMDLISLLLQLIMAFVTGIVLGAIYLRTDDIISVIIAHFAIDILGGIFYGGETTPYYFVAIMSLIWIFEAVYGICLVRKQAQMQ